MALVSCVHVVSVLGLVLFLCLHLLLAEFKRSRFLASGSLRGERLISWDVLCSETAESAARTEVPRLSAREESAQKEDVVKGDV